MHNLHQHTTSGLLKVRKTFFYLSRRLKLLNPLFEEIRDVKETVTDESFQSLVSLMEALESTKKLLRLGSEGSKICLVWFLELNLVIVFWGFSFVCVDLGGLIVD
ncbi:hypothetical protein Hanom_Chr11g01049601 [Helianthus anomalus]